MATVADAEMFATTLSASELVFFTARLKAAYEALQPKTVNGEAGNGRPKVAQVGQATLADRFTAKTAAKAGRS